MLVDVVEHKHRVRLAPREIAKTRTKVVPHPGNKGRGIDLLLGHVASWDNKAVEIAGRKQRKVLIVIKRITQTDTLTADSIAPTTAGLVATCKAAFRLWIDTRVACPGMVSSTRM